MGREEEMGIGCSVILGARENDCIWDYYKLEDIFLILEGVSAGLVGSHKEHREVLDLKAAKITEGQV